MATDEQLYRALSDFYKRNLPLLPTIPIKEFVPRVEYQHIGSTEIHSTPHVRRGQSVPEQVFNLPPPMITTVAPSVGKTDGGTTITISGSGFFANANLQVFFVYPDGTETLQFDITATDPDGKFIHLVTTASDTADTVDVKVKTTAGEDTKTGGFTYFVGLRIDVIDPNVGSTSGGYSVTLYGRGFRPFDLQVSFGGNDVGGIIINDDGTQGVVASVPAHVAGSVDVTAISPVYNDQYVFPLGFTYGGSTTLAAIDYSVDGGNTWRFQNGFEPFLVNGALYNVQLRALSSISPYTISTGYFGAPKILLAYNTGGGIFVTQPGFGSTVQFTSGLAQYLLQGVWSSNGDPTTKFLGIVLQDITGSTTNNYLNEYSYNTL